MRRLLLLLVTFALVATTAHAKPPRWQTLPLPPPMPAATSTGFVEVAGGAKIFYATYGKGTTPVVLLHGGLGNADHFGFQLPALADDYRVIAIDSRGQGRSTLTKAKLSYHVMAGDVLAVMDHLKLDAAALVGWSDGGAIALDIAVNHPKRVSKLFVFGTNYHADGSKPRKKGGSPKTFTAYAAKCKSDYMKLSKTPNAYAATVNALLPIWRSAGGFTKDQMRSITVPTVVADGEHDEIIVLDHIREMSLLIPNAKLVIFKDASHFALWQDPDAFNKALVEFLAARK